VSSPGVQASKRRRWAAAAAATALKDTNIIPTTQKFSAAILPLVLGPLANTVAAGQLSKIWAEEEEEEEERLQRNCTVAALASRQKHGIRLLQRGQ
jgi:hypothetical protein